MLASRLGTFESLHVADLFAGTGALGLEALSRGAAHCTFVEKDRAAIATLQRNIATFSAEDRCSIVSQGLEYAPPPARPCDLVLLDPPYESELAGMGLARIGNPMWVAPGGWVSVETSGKPPPAPQDFALVAERRFGKAFISLFRREK